MQVYPENPTLVRLWRGDAVESQHRGAWCLVDTSGRVMASAGACTAPYYARSSLKCLQALPLLESGAARRFQFSEEELALALASHDAEAIHIERVAGLLRRLGLGPEALQCGPQEPRDASMARALRDAGKQPGPIHNNCSGKHAGFLALALHLGTPPAEYLTPDSAVQAQVRRAVAQMSGEDEGTLKFGVDGCGAPTYQLPLTALAMAYARVSNPDALTPGRAEACRSMLSAVTRNPSLIGGSRHRICSDLARVTGGRLFPKVGGEAIYAVGIQGTGLGLAIKIDDGGTRGLHPLLVALLERHGFLSTEEAQALGPWRQHMVRNWSGAVVGHTEVLL